LFSLSLETIEATSLYVVVPLFTTASITDFEIFLSPGFFLSSIVAVGED
jgi:hypothetical protein